MEALAMAENDFLQQVLDMMDKRLGRVEEKIDKNTSLTEQALAEGKHTNGRLTSAEKRIKILEAKKGKKIDLPPNVIYLIALSCLVVLIIVASLLGVNLGGLVK